jgi:hypothetical protein
MLRAATANTMSRGQARDSRGTVRRALAAVALIATVAVPARADDLGSLTVEFRRHPPASAAYPGYQMMLVAETERRAGQRHVIAERADGKRETLGWWSEHLGRWITTDGQQWEDVRARAARVDETGTGTCRWNIIVAPPEMAGEPGLWLHADPDGEVEPPAEGCPTSYPRWSVSPDVRFKAYHRPNDAANGNNDPGGYGNWANITNPESGATYTVRVEVGDYSTEILVTAP